jgi:hypothetical protein
MADVLFIQEGKTSLALAGEGGISGRQSVGG